MSSSSSLCVERHQFGVELVCIQFRHVDEDGVNPHLFDEDFSPAVSTGLSKVWGGTHALLRFLQSTESAHMEGRAVLELGAGLGLVGICAAFRGCHVLLTDVSSVTAMTKRNIQANRHAAGNSVDVMVSPWRDADRVGRGSAACMDLNWWKDAHKQANSNGQDLSNTAFIIACEVIWLQELLQPYVKTLAYLLHCENRPVCYMSYTVRGTERSTVFTDESRVRQSFRAASCTVTPMPAFASLTADGEPVVLWKVTAAG
eukprot:jgi/Ulvmu1/12053/UM083_0066.1